VRVGVEKLKKKLRKKMIINQGLHQPKVSPNFTPFLAHE
jgi:hypothetical protein